MPIAVAMERRTQGPSPEDWDHHRNTLRDLYLDRKMSVRQVREHMALYYDFCASEKMYKTRLTSQWGIRKRPRGAKRAIAASSSASISVDSSERSTFPPDGQNRPVILRRASSAPDDGVPAAPRLLAAPGDLRILETCLVRLDDFVAGHSEGNLWPRDSRMGFKNEDIVPKWCSPLMSAVWVFNEGKVDDANKLLQQFVRQCPKQLARQDPLLFAFIYTSVLFLSRRVPEAAKQLLWVFRSALEKSLPRAGASHPLHVLLQLLCQMGPERMYLYADRILLAYIDMIHRALGGAWPIVQEMLSDAMNRLLVYKLATPQRMVDLCRSMMKKAERDDFHRTKCYLNLLRRLSEAYFEMGDYSKARETLMEIMQGHNDQIRDSEIEMFFHRHMCNINEADGQLEDAYRSSLQAVVIAMETLGKGADWTVNNLILHRKLLERIGETALEESARSYRDEAIAELYKNSEARG